ncbi:hypothetical protein B0G76_4899 [Paraburkholderia sp. BL23I1N1]|uniref:hypothetical protein n=1 Tax=Paraburkholderia sp. BL23I1N1 TaxID=1938802 RepID=UPI000E7597E2|nr:hypothetical protein [Paraburkholderia sp. BL23I1N1]RKE38569.1 hypothetical protein B0G76_4899 [Paraburkholderia sp. BL23I1N1]
MTAFEDGNIAAQRLLAPQCGYRTALRLFSERLRTRYMRLRLAKMSVQASQSLNHKGNNRMTLLVNYVATSTTSSPSLKTCLGTVDVTGVAIRSLFISDRVGCTAIRSMSESETGLHSIRPQNFQKIPTLISLQKPNRAAVYTLILYGTWPLNFSIAQRTTTHAFHGNDMTNLVRKTGFTIAVFFRSR